MKIDVEYSERDALRGAKGLLTAGRLRIVIELECEDKETERLLEGFRYRRARKLDWNNLVFEKEA